MRLQRKALLDHTTGYGDAAQCKNKGIATYGSWNSGPVERHQQLRATSVGVTVRPFPSGSAQGLESEMVTLLMQSLTTHPITCMHMKQLYIHTRNFLLDVWQLREASLPEKAAEHLLTCKQENTRNTVKSIGYEA